MADMPPRMCACAVSGLMTEYNVPQGVAWATMGTGVCSVVQVHGFMREDEHIRWPQPLRESRRALLFLITYSVFRLAARRTELRAKARLLESRAGKRKTCWTKPLAQAPGLWAFNEPGWLGGAHDWGFRFGGLAPFEISTGLSSCQRRRRVTPAPPTGAPTTQAAQASRPRSGGRFCFARLGRSIWAHDVSGTDWQILARSMQPITTMMPVWQWGHSRNECPVSTS
jgi:hypothetical protein